MITQSRIKENGRTLSLSSRFSIWLCDRRKSATALSLSASTRESTAEAARDGDGERARDTDRRSRSISTNAYWYNIIICINNSFISGKNSS
jgi:hypothetical protein